MDELVLLSKSISNRQQRDAEFQAKLHGANMKKNTSTQVKGDNFDAFKAKGFSVEDV